MENYENEQEQEQNKSGAYHNGANRITDGIKKLSNSHSAQSVHGESPSKNISNHHPENSTGVSSNTDMLNPGVAQRAEQAKNMGQAAGKAASAGATSAASSTGGAVASGVGGTAAGAAAGSVAPVIGTAIGAAAGKVAESAKKAKEASETVNIENIKNKGGGFEVSQNNNVADTNIIVKLMISIAAIFSAIIIIVLVLCITMIESVAAPIMAVFKLAEAGYSTINSRFSSEASFEEIQEVFISDLQNAFSAAYTDVCQDEVYQIAIEQGYDIELTMESYNNTQFPYILSGEECNINYAEIFNIISIADKFNYDDWKNFDYDFFCTLYEDKEFLRTLYTLHVEKAEKYIVNESMLSQGESCEIHSDKSVTITHEDGSTSTYTGDAANAYYDIIIYGEVSVSPYGLLEMFDYFEVDPYATSEIIPNMTNWKAMEYQEYFTICYKPNTYWGSGARSQLIPYEHQTGEIVENANMYIKDIFRSDIVTEDFVYFDVVEYKQADPRWGSSSYLGKTMASYGCCITSMAMVINYYGNGEINPGNLLAKMDKEYSGLLDRPALSEDFGFWHYLDDNSFNMHSDLTKILGALTNEQLVIAHIKPNSSEHFATKNGHWIVLHGYQKNILTEGSGYFFVNDPNRNNEIMTFLEAANLIDRIQSYGYK